MRVASKPGSLRPEELPRTDPERRRKMELRCAEYVVVTFSGSRFRVAVTTAAQPTA